ncbi:Bidirectional sugar transporter sweet15 [Castilleja foliolosa]|uniref:Bidirectional sugar transporter sweet15 n=1 Tax=Castilleja foliolosa TaxID=1961234 RepID=A0ABD3CXM4_9LAMI
MTIPQYSVVALGILGTISSILVYLSPLPTFYGIVKRKSSVGFIVVPYSVALFSATLYLYYGLIEKAIILITSNSFGLLMQSIYIIIYMLYAQ